MPVFRCSAAALFMLASAAGAAAEPPADDGGRYTMSPVDGGFLRLDRQTGAVSLCARSSGSWSCDAVVDHSAASPSREIARLESENRTLKERIKALEDNADAAKVPPLPPPPGAGLQLPTDEEVDQALDYLQRVYKKIRDRVKELDKPPPAAPAPPGPPHDAPGPPHKESL